MYMYLKLHNATSENGILDFFVHAFRIYKEFVAGMLHLEDLFEWSF